MRTDEVNADSAPEPPVVGTASVTGDSDPTGPVDPPAALLVAVFAVLAVALAFPHLGGFGRDIPGDEADSILNLWIIRSVQDGILHRGVSGFWDAPIYSPSPDTLAYSDTLFPIALLHWPLRLILGDAAALNLIALASWTFCGWFTYCIARRFVVYWGAAFVAAVAFTYSVSRIAQVTHLQLILGGALLPLVVLLLLRLHEHPSPWRGAALGAAYGCVVLTASYYGEMMVLFLAAAVLTWIVIERRKTRPAFLAALAVAAVVAGVIVGPFAVKYAELQRDPHFQRAYDPLGSGADLGDFTSVPGNSYLLRELPVLEAGIASVEHQLFPGFIAFGFGVIGAGIVLAEVVRPARRKRRTVSLLVLGIAGFVCLLMAFGEEIYIRGHPVPTGFAVLRSYVPGFTGMRAVSRLVIGGELVLTLFAAVSIDALVARVPGKIRTALAVGLLVFVAAESVSALRFVRIPTTSDSGGVTQALRKRAAGPVAELPIYADGGQWPAVETSRQYLALADGHPRANGYSGFQPEGFEERAAALNQFPAPAAIDEARRLGIRYIVIRAPVSMQSSAGNFAFGTEGRGHYDLATAQQMVRDLPDELQTSVTELPGGYLVDLQNGRTP